MGLHCPAAAQQASFCQAARDGIITWHAFPFNAQIEMLNQELLQGAFQLTEDVDNRCGVDHKTVMSQVRLHSCILHSCRPVFQRVLESTAIHTVVHFPMYMVVSPLYVLHPSHKCAAIVCSTATLTAYPQLHINASVLV